MSNIAELEKYLDNKNVQAFLSMLRDAEGTSNTGDPYRTRFGSTVDDKLDLTKRPTFVKKEFTQTDGKKNKSGATGAYQFLERTWGGLVKDYGFTDFSPKTQDLGAIALLKQNGALQHIVNGDFDTAVRKSNSTWASLPGSPYAQKTRSTEFVQNSLSKGMNQPINLEIYDIAKINNNKRDLELQTEEPLKKHGLDFAVLDDGTEVHPESEAELEFLTNVANNNTRTAKEKDRLARMGVLFDNNIYDINFSNDRRKNYPTELDGPLRKMIRES